MISALTRSLRSLRSAEPKVLRPTGGAGTAFAVSFPAGHPGGTAFGGASGRPAVAVTAEL